MRGRHWRALAMGTVLAFSFAACAGDEGADDTAADTAPAAEAEGGDMAAETPAATPTGQQAMNLPEGVTQEQVDEGRQLFSGQGGCHACHGPDATGTQLAPDLTDGEWINISGRNMDEIVELINNGVAQPQEHPSPMPPMGGASLSAEQVDAIAAYIVSLGQG
jgi:mono/diheme cytochrome c family protein